MKFKFSVTKHTHDTNKHNKGIDQEVLYDLATKGIEVDMYDGNGLYDEASKIMNCVGIDNIICSLEKGDHFFMILTEKDREDLRIVVDKKNVMIPNTLVVKKEELDLEKLVSSYC